MKPVLLRIAGLVALALCLAGCTSFESEWDRAVRLPAPASDPMGPWVGTWQNTNNTHGGALRAILVRESETDYRATFHATWGKRSGGFTTRLKGARDGNTLRFTGGKRLLFLKIRNRGEVSPTGFHSTYESRLDNGTFTLRRPE